MIDTASNTVVATIAVGPEPDGVAVAPDGKRAYVANFGSNDVSVIDTATTVVGTTIQVGTFPGVAISPDGKRAYVTNSGSNDVSVIDTATNKVVATVPVASGAGRIAATPDGKRAYVTNFGSNTVSVIDTASNTVLTGPGFPITVGNGPSGVGIVPPPPGVPFLAFAANLVLAFGGAGNQDFFALQTSFILSSTAPPLTEPVTLQIGTFAVTIPPGSFKKTTQGFFVFAGVINGVRLEAALEHTGTLQYALQAKAVGASFTGTKP